jgi:hypothetical protein
MMRVRNNYLFKKKPYDYDFLNHIYYNLIINKFHIKNYKYFKNNRKTKWLINYFLIFNRLDILPVEIIYYILKFLNFNDMDIATRTEIINIDNHLLINNGSMKDRYDIDFILSLNQNKYFYEKLLKSYNQNNRKDIDIIKKIIKEKKINYFDIDNDEIKIRSLFINNDIYVKKVIPHYFIDNGVKRDILKLKNVPVLIRKRYLKNNKEVIYDKIKEILNKLDNYFKKNIK